MALTTHKDPIPVETLGAPVGEHRLRIKDEAKLAMILTSSFYRDPLVAVIRELLANAQDAHQDVIDRGDTPARPIQIHLDTLTNQLVISDFGTGVHPDLVTDLLLGLGGTDKDQDETRLGGWGLGAKSPFALANQWHFENRWEGQAYTYLAYMRDSVLYHGDPLVAPTDLPNGLTYRIPVRLAPLKLDNYGGLLTPIQRITETARFYAAYSKIPVEVSGTLAKDLITYDPNKPSFPVTINGHKLTVRFRQSGIKLRTLANTAASGSGAVLVLGTVPYPLEHESPDLIKGVDLPDIDIHAPIGFVDVTPSRDHFQSSDHTMANLQALGPEISKVLMASLNSHVTRWESDHTYDPRHSIATELLKVARDKTLFSTAMAVIKRLPMHETWDNPPWNWAEWTRQNQYLTWSPTELDPAYSILMPISKNDWDFLSKISIRTYTPSSASGYDWSEESGGARYAFGQSVGHDTKIVWNDVGPGCVTGARLIDRAEPDVASSHVKSRHSYNSQAKGFLVALHADNPQTPLTTTEAERLARLLGLPKTHLHPFSAFTLNAAPAPATTQGPTSSHSPVVTSAPAPLSDWRLVQVGGIIHGDEVWRDDLSNSLYARPTFGAADGPVYYVACSRSSVTDLQRADIATVRSLMKDELILLVRGLHQAGFLPEIDFSRDYSSSVRREGHIPTRLYFVQKSGLSWWTGHATATDAVPLITGAVARAVSVWSNVGNHFRSQQAYYLDSDLARLAAEAESREFYRLLASLPPTKCRALKSMIRASRTTSKFPELDTKSLDRVIYLINRLRASTDQLETSSTILGKMPKSAAQDFYSTARTVPDFWTRSGSTKIPLAILKEAPNSLLRTISAL